MNLIKFRSYPTVLLALMSNFILAYQVYFSSYSTSEIIIFQIVEPSHYILKFPQIWKLFYLYLSLIFRGTHELVI